MPLTLYYIEQSPPCRAVWMLLKLLKLDFNLKVVDTLRGEQFKPEFLEINPAHTVPVLEDDGFYLWESHAILRYLMNKYAQSDALYPNDAQKRAVVDKLLDCDYGLFMRLHNWMKPMVHEHQAENPEKRQEWEKALDILNTILPTEGAFLTGDQYTIADLAIINTLTMTDVVKFDYSKWEKISKFIDNGRQIPTFKECFAGVKIWVELFEEKKSII